MTPLPLTTVSQLRQPPGNPAPSTAGGMGITATSETAVNVKSPVPTRRVESLAQ